MVETTLPAKKRIIIEWPWKRYKRPDPRYSKGLPWWVRWNLFSFSRATVQEFGGWRMNVIRHLNLFGWHILTYKRDEWHNEEPAERADRYLKEWSEAAKELEAYKRRYAGESMDEGTKKIMRDAFGVDFEEHKVEIMPVMVLSTTHLEEMTMTYLEAFCGPDSPAGSLEAWIERVRYGYMMPVPDTDDQNDGIQESFNGFPEIVEAVKLARKVKARRILWDRDGNVIPQLPTYDW